MKKVCVVGLGYIGLPTAVVLAKHGFEVVGFDIDEKKVKRINAGEPVIKEPGLFENLQTVLKEKNFYAATKIEPADYFIIAVPTPFTGDKKPDISYVKAAGRTIATVMQKGSVIIVESTVPVKATDAFAADLEKTTNMTVGKDFFVAHCPERVLPGNIFHELVYNARIIGGVGAGSAKQARALYAAFVKGDLYISDAATAELVKLVENSSRDVAIAFANQVASMAYDIGVDPYQVIALANKHPRVKILNPSCGVGGHCIAVDPWFLIDTFKNKASLLQEARRINSEKPNWIARQVTQYVEQWKRMNKGTCTVLALGLTYKPDIDDLRESPALSIAQQLQGGHNKDYEFLVCEPYVPLTTTSLWFKKEQVISFDEGMRRADIVVVLVAHKPFRIEFSRSPKWKKGNIIDYCGLLAAPPLSGTAKQNEYLSTGEDVIMMSPMINHKVEEKAP